MSAKAIINIATGHDGFVVARGVGPIINYHGKAVDLRVITLTLAEAIARDPHHRYVRFSDARIARDARAAIGARSTAGAPPSADAAAPGAVSGKDRRRPPSGE